METTEQQSPQGDKGEIQAEAHGAMVNFAGGLLDLMTNEPRMYGAARRAKRDGRLEQMYKQIMRYVLWVESLESAHEAQLLRIWRGKRLLSIIASVRQNEE